METPFLEAFALYSSLFLIACDIGAMAYFAAGVAPWVHKTLSKADAAKLTSVLFPIYYLLLAVICGLAAMAAFVINAAAGLVLLVIAAGFLFARQIILPQLNALREDVARGSVSSKNRYDAMHAWSVRMNMLQLLVLLIVFWFLALSI